MISKKDVKHIASLARLELSPKEETKMQKDLSVVLDYFDVIKRAPVSGVEPMAHGVEKEIRAELDGDAAVGLGSPNWWPVPCRIGTYAVPCRVVDADGLSAHHGHL